MPSYSSYRGLKASLATKLDKEIWYRQSYGYFTLRYHPIERRLAETFRYVELAPQNAETFSYEFASILRDIGGVFGSILDKLVRNKTQKLDGRFDISDYLTFLNEEVEGIKSVGCQLYSAFEKNMVFPFLHMADEQILWKDRLYWWEPYNNIKHSEIDNLKDGCLSNVIYGMSSLSILYVLMSPYRLVSNLFSSIGHFEPMDKVIDSSFPKWTYVPLP